MRKLIVIFLVIFLAVSVIAATSPSKALLQYYSAAENEDLETYFDVIAVEGMDQEIIDYEKKVVELAWNSVSAQRNEVKQLEELINEKGDAAIMRYLLDASYRNDITMEDTIIENTPYVALALKEGGEWKIGYAVPLSEYIDMKDMDAQLRAMEAEIEEYSKDGNAPAPLYIDGDKYVPGKDSGGGIQGGLKSGILNLIDMLIGLVFILIVIIFCVLILLVIKGELKKGKAKETKIEKKETQRVVEEKEEQVEKNKINKKEKKESGPTKTTKSERSDAMKILRSRYAKGEITKKEFGEIKQELGD